MRASMDLMHLYFEISLVKVPLMNLTGVQFRRVQGDAWQYKNVCSQLLELLKL
ncbi:hypothetical protein CAUPRSCDRAFT_8276 [Caulochytrium protostelioides]|uniref:non-specific serine/threonine protein kinase n=1 Tax=Caulochytrium protostelioides TaxID=1555241 RepID=A0A4P9WVI5_9FUNG|nr:hypothetical protein CAUPRSCDRAFT_8276 [Caulochytrium protostelioides]